MLQTTRCPTPPLSGKPATLMWQCFVCLAVLISKRLPPFCGVVCSFLIVCKKGYFWTRKQQRNCHITVSLVWCLWSLCCWLLWLTKKCCCWCWCCCCFVFVVLSCFVSISETVAEQQNTKSQSQNCAVVFKTRDHAWRALREYSSFLY